MNPSRATHPRSPSTASDFLSQNCLEVDGLLESMDLNQILYLVGVSRATLRRRADP